MLFIGLATTICAGVGLAALGKPSLLLHDPQLAVHDWLLAISIGPFSSLIGWSTWNLPGIALLGMAQQYGLIWAVTFETPSVVTSVRCECLFIFFISLKTHVWTQICHQLFNLDFSGQQKNSSNKTFRCVMKMIRSLQILMAFGVQVHHWYILNSTMSGVLIWLTKIDCRWSYSTSSPCWQILWEQCWSSAQSSQSLWRSQGMMEQWLLKNKHWTLQLHLRNNSELY